MSTSLIATDELKSIIFEELKSQMSKLEDRTLTLAIIVTGVDQNTGEYLDPATAKYVKAKESFAKDLGIKMELVYFPVSSHQDDIISKIKELNLRQDITGIIIQIPSPVPQILGHLNFEELCNTVAPDKDVDGLSDFNLSRTPDGLFTPATPNAILTLLNYNKIDLTGKTILVVGSEGRTTGKPLCKILESAGLNVTKCDPKLGTTPGAMAEAVRTADIIFLCTPVPCLIRDADLRADGNQIIIDAGLARITTVREIPEFDRLPEGLQSRIQDKISKNGSMMCGNLHPECQYTDKPNLMFTPSEGAIGPLTVRELLRNVIKAGLVQTR